MKHLYYIRHGLSEANKANHWSGSMNTPLSSEGHEQAKKAGEKAKADGLAFDIIISSPLDRALHTAHHIANKVGYPIEDIHVRPEFVERSFGELEGWSNPEAVAKYKESEMNIDGYQNVERLIDLQWRTKKALEYLHSLPHERVLVVGHGAFARALIRTIEGQPITVHVEPLPNAEIKKLL